MNREEILKRLRENEPALRARGVAHAALFGSRARGDQRPESDTDILIDLDPAATITVFDYVEIKSYIGDDDGFRRCGESRWTEAGIKACGG